MSDPPPLAPRHGPFLRTSRRVAVPAIGLLCGAVMLTAWWKPVPLMVWNVSNSAPVGLYVITAASEPVRGGMVLSQMPSGWRQLASSRRYLPANVPLLKRVAAAPGDTICSRGDHIWINGKVSARRLAKDGLGRPMPAWNGCRTLARDELFLLMAESAASFDGRYFGPTARTDIIGRAHLLWARRPFRLASLGV
jgi:conjugative transfer signal peptidase TraF